jgi:hypothetical protein
MSEPFKVYVKDNNLLMRYLLSESKEIFSYFFEMLNSGENLGLANEFLNFLAPNPEIFLKIFFSCLENESIDWGIILHSQNKFQFKYALGFVQWILQDLNQYDASSLDDIQLFDEIKEKNMFYFDMSEYFASITNLSIGIFLEKRNQFILNFAVRGGLEFVLKVFIFLTKKMYQSSYSSIDLIEAFDDSIRTSLLSIITIYVLLSFVSENHETNPSYKQIINNAKTNKKLVNFISDIENEISI